MIMIDSKLWNCPFFHTDCFSKESGTIFENVFGMRVPGLYEGCSKYNETVLITFSFYEIQTHKYYKH